MDTTMNRRRLLTTAALGGAGIVGATALGSIAPEDAFAAPSLTVEPGAVDPHFVEGRVTSITGTMLLVTSSDSSLHSIRITDGTSSTTGDEKTASFVESRFTAISTEAARGEGEHLDSLARLLGETDRADFARFMKERYADLFTGLEQPRELLTRIEQYRGRSLKGA